MKIAIVGSPDTIQGFKAVGVEPYEITTLNEGHKIIDGFKKSSEYGIILITEDWAEKLSTELQTLEKVILPAVIRVPTSSSTDEGIRNLKRIVERAVGSDIYG